MSIDINDEEQQLELINVICDEVQYNPTVNDLSSLRELKFNKDINVDNIDLMCIFMLLEDEYNIIVSQSLEDKMLNKINDKKQDITIGEFLDLIIKKD